MRLREDDYWEAGHKRAILLGAAPDPRKDKKKNWDPLWLRSLNDPLFEPAKLGDAWVVRGDPTHPGTMTWVAHQHEDWPVIGFVLTCPNEKCVDGAHMWSHASDCPALEGQRCKSGGFSCWAWRGTIEDDTLSASPSLWANYAGCGWHGYLKDGELIAA